MYLIYNGITVTRRADAPFIENGAVAVDGETIAAVGNSDELLSRFPDAERIDAEGGVIMPGLIDAHTHLFRSFMRGMPEEETAFPETYYESLTRGTWRFDRTLDYFGVAYSALAGAAECIRNGVTALFCHHASSGSIPGSLFAIAGMIAGSGIRASLSYDTSQRCGFDACCEAIAENAGFISYCESIGHGRIKAMFGLGELFTLLDIDLDCCSKKNTHGKPFHVHFSEGPDDRILNAVYYGGSPAERLRRHGMLSNGSILAGCACASERDQDILMNSDVCIVSCPLSDTYRGLGTADVAGMIGRGLTVGLGTDGVTFDPLENARAFAAVQGGLPARSRLGVSAAAKMLFENNRLIAERSFGNGIGTLSEGAPADIIIMDRLPYANIDETNYDEHIIFGMSGRCVMTMCAGKILMRDGKLLTVDEKDGERIREETRKLHEKLKECGEYEWSRFSFERK